MEYVTAIYALGAISFVLLLIEVNYTYASQGTDFGWSANRPEVTLSPLGQRIKNAYGNQVESIAYTLPVLAAAALSDAEIVGGTTAALIMVIGRAIYGPLYISGIPYARLVGFGMGTLSAAYLLVTLALTL